MVKPVSCECKCKVISTTCNSNQRWNNKTCQFECRNDRTYKRHCSWNPSTCIYENGKHLKTISDYSKIVSYEILYVMDIASTNLAHTTPIKWMVIFWTQFY